MHGRLSSATLAATLGKRYFSRMATSVAFATRRRREAAHDRLGVHRCPSNAHRHCRFPGIGSGPMERRPRRERRSHGLPTLDACTVPCLGERVGASCTKATAQSAFVQRMRAGCRGDVAPAACHIAGVASSGRGKWPPERMTAMKDKTAGTLTDAALAGSARPVSLAAGFQPGGSSFS